MYAVKLGSTPAGYDRWLERDSNFTWNITDAEIFTTISDALQAIHTRGYRACREGWPTGNGRLHIVELENTPREKRVVS